ncbi:hypothetical protein GQ457_13G019400 [Hibiscus cannabinus]
MIKLMFHIFYNKLRHHTFHITKSKCNIYLVTTTNPLNTAGEIGKQIKDSKSVLAFTIPQLLPKLVGSAIPIVLLDENCYNFTLDGEDRYEWESSQEPSEPGRRDGSALYVWYNRCQQRGGFIS